MQTPLNFLKAKTKEKEIINLNDIQINDNILWHGIQVEHASLGLINKYLSARTTHRYWENGRTLKDNHPDYETSGWQFGWSTTRERNFAGAWRDVVFILDKKKIQEEFKVKPLSWSYKVSQGSGYFKKEREDFIVSAKDLRTLKEVKKDYHKIIDADDYNGEYEDMYDYWYQHNGKKLNLDKVLKGILISDSTLEIFGKDDEDVKSVMNHEKFLGVYSRKNAEKNIELQNDPAKSKKFKL